MLRIANDLAVRVLNAGFRQDPAAPVRAAADQLPIYRALMPQSFRAKRCQRVLDVFPDGIVWPLYSDQVLIFAGPAFQLKPVHMRFTLVLVSLDAVPPQYEVFGNVVDAISHQTDGNVMPRHASVLGLAKFIIQPVVDIFEIHDPAVIKVLPGPDVFVQATWVRIRQWMLTNVIPTETEVKTADEGNFVVDDDEFFVVCLVQFLAWEAGCLAPGLTHPVQSYLRQILKRIMVRMPDHMNIPMTWCALGAEAQQSMFGMRGVARQRLGNLHRSDETRATFHGEHAPPYRQ